MIFSTKQGQINTNLGYFDFERLSKGIWKLGLIKDNDGIITKSDDKFYEDYECDRKKYRKFKNKVNVKLIDGSIVNQHIIHWVESDGYFCVTFDSFWDQFD